MIIVPFLAVPVRFIVSLFNAQPRYSYRYENKFGVSYFLHTRIVGSAKTYYFSRATFQAYDGSGVVKRTSISDQDCRGKLWRQ